MRSQCLKVIYEAQYAGVCIKGNAFDEYFEDSPFQFVIKQAEALGICRLTHREGVGLYAVPCDQSRVMFER